MRLRVTQPDMYFASAAVRVYFNRQDLGAIGPGGMIDADLPHKEHYPYEVVAACGLCRATYHGHGDADLQVNWSMRTCTMELRKINGTDLRERKV